MKVIKCKPWRRPLKSHALRILKGFTGVRRMKLSLPKPMKNCDTGQQAHLFRNCFLSLQQQIIRKHEQHCRKT